MLASDGKEYGPVTELQIKAWVAEGRADSNTQLKRVGEASFVRLSDFPEFRELFPSDWNRSSDPVSVAPDSSSTPVAPTPPSGPIEVFNCFERGLELFKGNFGPFLGATLIMLVLTIVFSRLPTKYGQIIGTLANVGLYAGYNYFILLRSRGESAGIDSLFAGYRSPFLSLILSAVVSIILILVGFLVFIIPGIYLAVSYAFASMLIVDKKMGFWEALETSRRVVTKQWLRVLCLGILATLVSLLGLIGLGIGIIFTVPIATAAVVYAYDQLFYDIPRR